MKAMAMEGNENKVNMDDGDGINELILCHDRIHTVLYLSITVEPGCGLP